MVQPSLTLRIAEHSLDFSPRVRNPHSRHSPVHTKKCSHRIEYDQSSRLTLDVEIAPNSVSEAAKQALTAKRSTGSALGWTLLFFVAFWAAFYGLSRALPYLKNGSDIVFDAK